MSNFNPKLLLVVVLIFSGSVFLGGCGDSVPENGSANLKPVSPDDQIKRIEQNTAMPEEAKQRAIAALRRGGDNGKAMASAPKP